MTLGSALANDGGEVLVRWQVGNSSDNAGAVLRMSSGAASFYGVGYDGAGNVELFGQWGGSIHTNIGGVRVTYTPGTAKQWFRFRVAGSTLFFKAWADGSQEPANWSGQTTDATSPGPAWPGSTGTPRAGRRGFLSTSSRPTPTRPRSTPTTPSASAPA